MKITIIGAYGGYPGKESATSSFLIQSEGFSLLIDCGSGVLAHLQQYIKLQNLDACILSHYHHDHIADIGCLQYSMLIQSQLGNRSAILPIYAHKQDVKFSTLSFETYTIAKEIQADKKIVIGPFSVSFCETTHPAYCLAMKFESGGKSVIYSGDTEWNDNLLSFSANADLFICEASLYNEQFGKINGHLTAGEAGKLAEISNAKQLVLTHLPHYGDIHELKIQAEEQFTGEVLLAKKGLMIDLIK